MRVVVLGDANLLALLALFPVCRERPNTSRFRVSGLWGVSSSRGVCFMCACGGVLARRRICDASMMRLMC